MPVGSEASASWEMGSERDTSTRTLQLQSLLRGDESGWLYQNNTARNSPSLAASSAFLLQYDVEGGGESERNAVQDGLGVDSIRECNGSDDDLALRIIVDEAQRLLIVFRRTKTGIHPSPPPLVSISRL